jgi:hypothetical protein
VTPTDITIVQFAIGGRQSLFLFNKYASHRVGDTLAYSSGQLIKQRPRFLQIARVNPFGEPAVDRSEKLAGRIALVLLKKAISLRSDASAVCSQLIGPRGSLVG